VNLEELSPQQLRALRPTLGDVGQARVDELLGVATTATTERRPPAANQTEQIHAARLRADPDVERFEFNAIRLRLADGTWYKPDFWVVYRDGHEEMHEVKMRWWSRDRVRVKVAARLYGWRWTFRVFQKAREKEGGAWTIETLAGE
jgi:hypothetical protein